MIAPRTAIRSVPAIMLCACIVSGCAVDFDLMRRRHAEQFPEQLSARTSELLGDNRTVGLDECVRIALANNLDVRTARLNRRLARLDRKIAFSNFLPQVDLEVTTLSAGRQQGVRFGAGSASMSDRAVTRTVLSGQQSIFLPETWFLYEMYKKGEGVSRLLQQRTRNMIRLQVTTLYFACLAQARSARAIANSLERSESLRKELQALAGEGLALPSQVQQAETLLKTHQVELARNRRLQRETKSDLLDAMGLAPMGDITLRNENPLAAPPGDLADQVLHAMLNRPELRIADRTIEIRKDETRIAIARFLPKLVGLGDLTHSSDSFLKYSTMSTLGVSGVMTVFNGFRNVFEYRAARQREQLASIDRERACMTVMLEVIRARLQLDDAAEQCALARRETVSARTFMDETQAQWREGLIVTSDKLDAVSRDAAARANLSISEFRHQVAAATLHDVIGPVRGDETNEREKDI